MRPKKSWRVLAIVLCFNLVVEILYPTCAYALTAGPSSPEFSNFQPVSAGDMVSTFTGDFSYSLPVVEIPGPDGAGYALSLSYQSGAGSEDEASWVGFGWTLNPGAINRSTRGFPDDYNGENILRYSKARPNWNLSTTVNGAMELFSVNASKYFKGLNLSGSAMLGYNSYNGFRSSVGMGITPEFAFFDVFKANTGLNMNFSPGQGITFQPVLSLSIEVAKKETWLKEISEKQANKFKSGVIKDVNDNVTKYYISQKHTKPLGASVSVFSGGYGIWNFAKTGYTMSVPKYADSYRQDFKFGIMYTATPTNVGWQAGVGFSYNYQENEPVLSYKAYGYMHNRNGHTSNEIGDFSLEKGTSFEKRQKYLGIPFNNSDFFNVSGEGVSGSFKYYPSSIGNHIPTFTENRTNLKIPITGIDLNLGAATGIGLDIGLGFHISDIGGWEKNVWNKVESFHNFKFGNPEDGFFRFASDAGGQIIYGGDNEDLLDINKLGYLSDPLILMKRHETGRSSFIDYNTAGKVRSGKKFDIRTKVISSAPNESIAEINVLNASGTNYVYGQPVYQRNEAQVSFDVNVNASNLRNNTIHYTDNRNIPLAFDGNKYYVNPENGYSGCETVMGDIKQSPNANSFLLTQIRSVDYVDIRDDGCSNDDYGAWTQFSYFKKYGENTSYSGVCGLQPTPCNDCPPGTVGSSTTPWYRWRAPYNGMSYQRNTQSSKKDDLGSISSGQKEVFYLKSVETKTHIAFFVTNKSTPDRWKDERDRMGCNANPRDCYNLEVYLQGSCDDRKDGLGAKESNATGDPATAKETEKGNTELEKLEKIVIFSKERLSKPLKVVCFEYDYSLVKNLPNNKEGNYPNNNTSANSGKLTLKKVWFEYEGNSDIKTSPYEFVYKYKSIDDYAEHLRGKYVSPNFIANMSNMNDVIQNPNYSPNLLDAWGNVQPYGAEREKHGIEWRYQGKTPINPANGVIGSWERDVASDKWNEYKYDPAAWQLKQIKLPSGGEILIEYEEKEYEFVQDKAPMCMASLVSATDDYGKASIVVNAKDLGIDVTNESEVLAQIAKINDYFASEKLYFKFLYKLTGSGIPTINDTKSEYVTGYATSGIASLELKNGEYHIKLDITGNTKDGTTITPRTAAHEYYVSQRAGILESGKNLPTTLEGKSGRDIIRSLEAFGDGIKEYFSSYGRGSIGTAIAPALSFVKLPMIKPKKGGGARVKRLLTYDPGLEDKDANLYGQEYFYEKGVALNEPAQHREENPLVTFLEKEQQSRIGTLYNKIVSGIDKDQMEGALGESIMPGPSIGYGRVVIQNIHTGETGNGYTVQEFFTAHDEDCQSVLPIGKRSNHTDLNDKKHTKGIGLPPIPISYKDKGENGKGSVGAQVSIKHFYAVQGYLFVMTDMHGKAKSTSTFSGTYKLGDGKLVTKEAQEYYALGEKVRFLDKNNKDSYGLPGKEIEVALDMRAVKETEVDVSIGVDFTLGLPILNPNFSLSLNFAYSESKIKTHSNSKIVRYPAILKKTISTHNGVETVTEYLAFDERTGSPLLTRTEDSFNKVKKMDNTEHDGNIYSLNIPAYWVYPELDQKMKNANNLNVLGGTVASITTYGINPIASNSTDTKGEWTFQNVLQSQLQVYKKDWWDVQPQGLPETVFKSINKLYRPLASYTLRTDVEDANASGGRVYNAGYVKCPVKINFNNNNNESPWVTGIFDKPCLSPSAPSSWLSASKVVSYSYDGKPLEEVNAIGIPSAVRYGYGNMLPTIMGQNSNYNNLYFEDYEHLSANIGISHTGKKGKLANLSNSGEKIVQDMKTNDRLCHHEHGGATVKLWILNKGDNGFKMHINLEGGSGVYLADYDLSKIAQVGDWGLFEGTIPYSFFGNTCSGSFSIFLKKSSNLGAMVYSIDDVKFQPKTAQATCYVYDVATFKTLAQFDDQHFALLYQYDLEGKLARKQVETERGVHTITDSYFNTNKPKKK